MMSSEREGPYSVILVFSTSHALKGEKVLLGAGITSKLIPVPRHLSSDCGVCLRIGRRDREAVLQSLADAGVEIEGCYEI